MELTDQMKADFNYICDHIQEMQPFLPFIQTEMLNKRLTLISEMYIIEQKIQLSTFKVILENFLSETDLKERGYINRWGFGVLHSLCNIAYAA